MTIAAHGPMDTRQIAQHTMAANGLETGDKVLAKAIIYLIIHALQQQCRRGTLVEPGKHKNVRVWALPDQTTGVLSYC